MTTKSIRSDSPARDNHYVPQGLLQRWSNDGVRVFAYGTLVSHRDVPEWTRRSVRGSAFQRDLYTGMSEDGESDQIERWFANEYENPGLEASERLIRGQTMSREDWGRVIKFAALQHLRTPQSFMDSMTRWERTLPQLLDSTTRESLEMLRTAKEKGTTIKVDPDQGNAFAGLFDVKLEPNPDAEGGYIRTQVVIGRRLWLASVKHVLRGKPIEKLLEHQWCVWEPAENEEWPITDDPSLRVNYNGPNDFNFGGGWGSRGSELIMPLSPRHLLYTRVGRSSRRRYTASVSETRAVRTLLAKRAHRWIFATAPQVWIPRERPRVVDGSLYEHERAMWNRWHEDQVRSEQSTDS